MAKVEVQIRHCFCCGLSVATILIAIYSLFLFLLLTGLGAWGLSDSMEHGDASHYNACENENEGRPTAENRKWAVHAGQTTVVVEDTTSYFCSFGLYTHELKYSRDPRQAWLTLDICLWAALILASILLIVGIVMYNHWLLVPWILLFALDIIRGFISTFFIFWFSHFTMASLPRIATGIFFLGLQILHTSLLMLIIAKFQKIYYRRNGLVLDRQQYYDQTRAYPGTMISNQTYSPDVRRDPYYPDNRSEPYYAGPAPHPAAGYDNHGYPRY